MNKYLIMKKPEKSPKRRKAAANRAAKRDKRLKKTQKEKHIRKAKVAKTKALHKKKQQDFFDKLLESRMKGI